MRRKKISRVRQQPINQKPKHNDLRTRHLEKFRGRENNSAKLSGTLIFCRYQS